MADRLTPEQRFKCMSHNKGKDTKPELIVRKYLFAHGYRYRLHESRLPGHPDIVIKRLGVVIFVNGCFWHGHEGCNYAVIPKTNTDFWKAKIERNKQRDKETYNELKKLGWSIVSIWECQLKPNIVKDTLRGLMSVLGSIELSKSYKTPHSSWKIIK